MKYNRYKNIELFSENFEDFLGEKQNIIAATKNKSLR